MSNRLVLGISALLFMATVSVGNAETYNKQVPNEIDLKPNKTTEAVAMMLVATQLTAKDYLKTSFLPTELRDKFQGYQYSLQNKQTYHLEILKAEVLNGQDEGFVAEQEVEKAKKNKPLLGGLFKVVSANPFTPGIATLGSIGAFRAASITYNTAMETNHSEDATIVYISNQYIKSFEHRIINPKQTVQFLTFVPKGPSPKLHITFKNMETNQVLSFDE